MITRLVLVLALLAPLPAFAADPAPSAEKPQPAATKPAAAKQPAAPLTAAEKAGSLSTNVVGSQEAPTVLNVVPWKDKEVKLEKKNPTTNILNNVLQPLDRDVLRREVQYFRSLQEQQTQ